MNHRCNSGLLFFAAPALFLLAGCTSTPVTVVPGDYAVVVNSANDTEELTEAQFKGIFKADRQHWQSGAKVTLVLPSAGSPERNYLLAFVYQMNDRQLKRYWRTLLYQNRVSPIPSSRKRSDALKIVAKNKAAVALVKASELDAGRAGVKVLKIAGESLDSPGYLLRVTKTD